MMYFGVFGSEREILAFVLLKIPTNSSPPAGWTQTKICGSKVARGFLCDLEVLTGGKLELIRLIREFIERT